MCYYYHILSPTQGVFEVMLKNLMDDSFCCKDAKILKLFYTKIFIVFENTL